MSETLGLCRCEWKGVEWHGMRKSTEVTAGRGEGGEGEGAAEGLVRSWPAWGARDGAALCWM